MKIISTAFLQFALFVAAAAQGFLNEGGSFSKKLDYKKIHGCIKECKSYVDDANCNSLCTTDTTKFRLLMNKVYTRIKEPICGLDLSNIEFGEVEIPLAIDQESRKCFMRGPLNVAMTKNVQDVVNMDSCVTAKPSYQQRSQWDIEFKGLTVYCSPNPSTIRSVRLQITDTEKFQTCVKNSIDQPNSPIDQCVRKMVTAVPVDLSPQVVGRADVKLSPFYSEQNFQFSDRNKQVVTLGAYYSAVSLAYPAGTLKNISLSALNLAVRNAFTSIDVMTALNNYFFSLSIALYDNCIVPACYQIISTCSPLISQPLQDEEE